jgi:hypothetical protein
MVYICYDLKYEIVQYLTKHEKIIGLDIDEDFLKIIGIQSDIDVLNSYKYYIENENIEILKWLIEHFKCFPHEDLFFSIIEKDNVELLDWAIEYGFVLSELVMDHLLRENRTDLLEYMILNGVDVLCYDKCLCNARNHWRINVIIKHISDGALDCDIIEWLTKTYKLCGNCIEKLHVCIEKIEK